MKNDKDEKLSELFSAYTSEEKSPDISATNKAKEYMNKTRVAEKATVTAAETAGGSSVGSGAGVNNRKKTLITVAVAVFLIALAIVCYHVANGKSGGGANFSSSALKTVEITEDNVTSAANYEDKDFLPFIESKYVEGYDEYKLKKSAAGYEKGAVVVYYVKVDITENEEIADTEFEIFVELPRVKMKKLDEYKNAPKSTKIENITFYYGSEDGDAYYFVYNDYGYNLKIINADDKKAVLTYIAKKFRN